MDIKKELEEVTATRRGLLAKIQQSEQEKQQLLQEALRLDGEIRLLQRLINEEVKK